MKRTDDDVRIEARIASEWTARMYELLFGEAPRAVSHPGLFQPSSAELGLVVASPDGLTARLSVLTDGELSEDLASVILSEGLSALALAPVRVFPLGGPVIGGTTAQVHGPRGAAVLSYTAEWSSAMPHLPPRLGSRIQIEFSAPKHVKSGVLAVGTELSGVLVVEDIRTPGKLLVSASQLAFVPSGVDGVLTGPRCCFLGTFAGHADGRWVLTTDSEGTLVGAGTRGRATWVVAGDRLGVRFEMGRPRRDGDGNSVYAQETMTLETSTLSVDPVQIESVVDDVTAVLRRPE